MRSVFKRPSYLDLVIIALVLCFFLSLLSRYAMQKKRDGDASRFQAEISFEAHGISKELSEALLKDYNLLFTNGRAFGELSYESAEIRRATVFHPDLEGNLISAESNTLYDLFGVIYASGFVGEGGFLLNGESYIAPNMSISVKNSIAEAEIFIVDLKIF